MPYPGAGSASKACSAMSAEVGSHDSQVSCHVMYTDELTNPKHEKPYFASMLSGNLKWLCFGPRPLPGHTRHQELSFTVPSGLLVNQRNRSVIWSLKVTIPDSGFLRWSRSFPAWGFGLLVRKHIQQNLHCKFNIWASLRRGLFKKGTSKMLHQRMRKLKKRLCSGFDILRL